MEKLDKDPEYIRELNNSIRERDVIIDSVTMTNELLMAKLKEITPYANMGRLVTDTSIPISIEELSKYLNTAGIDIGRNRLFDLLRTDGYLMKNGIGNRPTQKSLDNGLMLYIPTSINGHVIGITYITPNGIKYFISRYRNIV